ncbi:MAG TPA: PH domain-containing protein [Micromonosporaceae bacterium]
MAADDLDDFDDFDEPEPLPPAAPLTSASWRVDRVMLAAKVVGIVAFAAVPQVFQLNLTARYFGAIVAVALVIYAIRDLAAPVRLSADQDGVRVIAGFAGHRDIPWSDVEGLRLDPRRRSGFLEIETADTLHLLSRYDLSMAPADALDMLERIRSSRPAA